MWCTVWKYREEQTGMVFYSVWFRWARQSNKRGIYSCYGYILKEVKGYTVIINFKKVYKWRYFQFKVIVLGGY